MPATPSPLSAEKVFDREGLTLRAQLLDVASLLDRLERAAEGESIEELTRLPLEAIRELLISGNADRVDRLLRLYSRDYDPAWQERFAAATSVRGKA